MRVRSRGSFGAIYRHPHNYCRPLHIIVSVTHYCRPLHSIVVRYTLLSSVTNYCRPLQIIVVRYMMGMAQTGGHNPGNGDMRGLKYFLHASAVKQFFFVRYY
jgi:hypothetical protein